MVVTIAKKSHESNHLEDYLPVIIILEEHSITSIKA